MNVKSDEVSAKELVNEVKPGWETSEFWMTLLGHAAVIIAAVAGLLPPKYAALAATASQVAYNVSRGLAKNGATITPGS